MMIFGKQNLLRYIVDSKYYQAFKVTHGIKIYYVYAVHKIISASDFELL